MAIEVKLKAFEGPLDLLLHLIEKNKVDIYDIPIVEITDQYMEYVARMEDRSLDVMSEFMVMAATLLDIKCRMLLPREKNEEGEEEDPRTDLVERLLEYKLYKYMGQELKDKMEDSYGSFYHKKDVPKEVTSYEEPVDIAVLLEGLTLERLDKIYKGLVRKAADRVDPIRSQFGTITKEPVSISDKMLQIKEFCKDKTEFSFKTLLEMADSRTAVVVSFLCILELMKRGYVHAQQEKPFGDIFLNVMVPSETWVHLTEDAEDGN